MTAPCIVTIGSQHHGLHVDQLYALAERCGAIVQVVQPDGTALAVTAPRSEPRRASYAGRDPFEAPHFTKLWHQETRP